MAKPFNGVINVDVRDSVQDWAPYTEPSAPAGSPNVLIVQLFHTDVDRAEAHDLAEENPDKLRDLIDVWFNEAGKYDVLPLDDRLPLEIILAERPSATSATGRYLLYPGTTELPERSAPNTRGRSFKILAEVEITDADADGVLFAHGSQFGGHTLFIKERKLFYVNSFIGVPPEQQFVGSTIATGKHVLGMEFIKESIGDHQEAHGTTKLYIDDAVVAEGPMRTQPGHFALCGEGLSIGRDSGAPVSKEYKPPYAFRGGRIVQVEVVLADDQYLDLENEAMAMLARE